MRTLSFVAVAVALACSMGHAQDAPPSAVGDDAWSFQIENDMFGKGQTDRYYSNGLRLIRSQPMRALSRIAGDGWLPRYQTATANLVCWIGSCDPAQASAAVDLHGGQSIYTPQNLLRTAAYPYDRPYAGWLYLGLRSHVADRPDASGEASRLQSLDINIGVVGPAAGADKVQKAWHKLIDATEPTGWNSQLRNEPTLQLSFTSMRRTALGTHTDALPYWRLTAGNVFTHVAMGAHVRIGQGLGGFAVFDPTPASMPNVLRMRSRDRPVPASRQTPDRSWHLFAAFEARAVARNLFVDGNTFRNYPNPSYISHRPFVGDFTLGFTIAMTPQWRLTYGHIWRSREYSLDRQPPRGTAPPSAVQRYGVIQLQYES